jgi:transposase
MQRRRITLTGVKPLGPVPFGCETFYLYGAVEPSPGANFCRELPQLNTANFQIFLHAFGPQDQDTLNSVLMDNGSCHTAKSLVTPAKIAGLFWPPYRPELKPIERLWQEVKAPLAWVLPPRSEAFEAQGETIIRHDANAAMQARTSSPYVVQAVNALCS